jgi:hypothetical protein
MKNGRNLCLKLKLKSNKSFNNFLKLQFSEEPKRKEKEKEKEKRSLDLLLEKLLYIIQ